MEAASSGHQIDQLAQQAAKVPSRTMDAPKIFEIDQLAQRIAAQADAVYDRIGMLGDRVQPALSPPHPENAEDTPRGAPLTTLGTVLDAALYRLESCERFLTDLHGRVEL